MTKEQFNEDIEKYITVPITVEQIERTLAEINKSEILSNSVLKTELKKDLRGLR